MFKKLLAKLTGKTLKKLGEPSLQENLIKYITKTIRNPKFNVVVAAVPMPLNDKELGFTFYLTNSKGEIELKGEVKLDDAVKYGKIL